MNMIITEQWLYRTILVNEGDPHELIHLAFLHSSGKAKSLSDHQKTVGWTSEANRLALGANRLGKRSKA